MWSLRIGRFLDERRRKKKSDAIQNRVDELLQEAGLTKNILERLATSQGWKDLPVEVILERLGFDTGDAPSWYETTFWRVTRIAFATFLFIAVTFLVIGAILEGRSALFPDNPILALLTLLLLLIVLGLFEGLQISVALLRLKDIDSLAISHPHAARLHRLFRTEKGTRRFLAGRQFFVVFVVFFIARITTFPSMRTVPLFEWQLPPQLELLWLGAFDLGLLGAFLVLWTAQLAPQFGANKNPQGFLNIPGMELVLHSSFAVDDFGVTLPGFWFAEWVPDANEIPNSRSERFKIASETGKGLAALLMRRSLICTSDATAIESEKQHLFLKGGYDLVADESFLIEARKIEGANIGVRLVRSAKERPVTVETRTSSISDIATLYSFYLSPKVGSFEKGDLLTVRADVECHECYSHRVEITEPTRLLHVIIQFDESSFFRIGSVQVRRAGVGEPSAEAASLPFEEEGPTHTAEYFAVFLEPGEILEFSWTLS